MSADPLPWGPPTGASSPGEPPAALVACPVCGSGDVKRLRWGFAPLDLGADEVAAGCVLPPAPQDSQCGACGHRWFAGRDDAQFQPVEPTA